MRYMMLIYVGDGAGPEQGSEEQIAEMQEWFGYTQALEEAGVLLGGDALQGIDTAVTVRVRDGETATTDGPFAETKEALGGYYMIDVESEDEAVAWAAKIPSVRYGSIEVRPIFELADLQQQA